MKYVLLTLNRESDPVERSPINNDPESEVGVRKFKHFIPFSTNLPEQKAHLCTINLS